MHYRKADYIDIDRLTRPARPMSESMPVSLASRLILSVGMIIAPVVAFFLILGIDRLVATL